MLGLTIGILIIVVVGAILLRWSPASTRHAPGLLLWLWDQDLGIINPKDLTAQSWLGRAVPPERVHILKQWMASG